MLAGRPPPRGDTLTVQRRDRPTSQPFELADGQEETLVERHLQSHEAVRRAAERGEGVAHAGLVERGAARRREQRAGLGHDLGAVGLGAQGQPRRLAGAALEARRQADRPCDGPAGDEVASERVDLAGGEPEDAILERHALAQHAA